jgi:multidrug efflux pump
MILSLTSDTLPVGRMYDAADSILAQKISQVEGVGQVVVGGGAKPAVRVQVNPTQLSSYGLGLEDVRSALANANANSPKGELTGPHAVYSVWANDQLLDAELYNPLIVAYRNGAPVRISDIGNAFQSQEDIHNAGLYNNKPSVAIIIFKQPGANIIGVVDDVKALMPFFQASIPPAIKISIAMDRTTTIRASVHDVEITLLIAVCLVVMVIFLFLRNLSATTIPAVAVPLSLVGTLAVMYLFGYTIDNLSLMALTIATGFVVDDAIVVVENISRYIEKGEPPFESALKGSREIGFTVLSMSTSLVAVFIPILLMGGIVGRLFREFAVVLSVTIAVSLLVSLTTTPMMAAKFLEPLEKRRPGRLYRASEKVFDRTLALYSAGLKWVLRHSFLVLFGLLGTVALAIYLYIAVPKGFFPQQDTGRLMGAIQASQDISFDALKTKQQEFSRIVMADPAVDSVVAFTGGGSSNTGRGFIQLKDLSVRKISADQVIARLRPKLARIPGATLFLQAVQDVRVGGRGSNAQYQYTLEDADLQELNRWAPQLLARLQKLPQLRDVSSDQQNKGLQSYVAIDRDTAARLGVQPAMIDNTLYDAFGQRQVSTMYKSINQYHVVLEVAPQFQQSPEGLRNIYVTGAGGAQIPLSAFAHYEQRNSALAIPHQGQFPAITMSFNLAPGASLSDAVKAIDGVEAEMHFPASIHASFQGTAAAYQQSLANQPVLIFAALFAVYIVLGMLYESYIHPITILSTLPSAGVGALLALLVFRTQLDIIALIGIILLIGIVKKNAIMMIDFALDAERKHGLSSADAIFQACMLRFRPILMTTMAALFGALPLAFLGGTGSELRRPLGLTIVGGLIVSQAQTLFTTPVIYLYMDRMRLALSRWWRGYRAAYRSITGEA